MLAEYGLAQGSLRLMVAVRILIADDHEFVRRGVRALLESRDGFEVCFEAANGQEAVEKARELKPDLIILDITMPILSGFDAARKIKEFSPETPIVILSMHRDKEYVEEAQKIGIQGYVRKSQAALTLVTAVDAVLQDQTFFPAEL